MTLIHKHLNGQSDLAGMTELKAMRGVGSEFMTSDDGANRVQKSGEFVEISHRGGTWLRMLSVCEPANNRTDDGVLFDDDTAPGPGSTGFVPRTFVVKVEAGSDGDESVQRRAVPAWQSRLPRFTLVEGRDAGVDTVTKLGRQRVWALPGGQVLRAREVGSKDDGRYFYGSRGVGQPVRRERVARVELMRSNPDTLSGAEVLMEFSPISGLGFDAGARQFITDFEGRGTTNYDDNYVYTDRAGYHFGRLIGSASGDPSGTYVVAPPAMVIQRDGDLPYLHLAAVYARPEDLADQEISTPRQLTCTYLSSAGEVQHSTIEFAPFPTPAGRYPGVMQYRLYRLAPQSLLLVSSTTPMIEPGGAFLTGTDFSGPSVRLHWSADGGASWVETPASAWGATPAEIRSGFVPMGAVVPQGAGRALVFTGYVQGDAIPAPDAEGVHVLQLTPDAVTLINTIPGSAFSRDLLRPIELGGKDFFARYAHAAEAGGTCGKLAWAQFDPAWMQPEGYAWGVPASAEGGLGFPFERPMIMVTEDDGATFARRLLPDPVASRVGFVIALDTRTLAVPVFFPRERSGDTMPTLRGKIYTSRNGGRTWRGSARFTLPYYCRADGQLFSDEYVDEYSPDRFNRGELFPLVPLADELERTAAISPGRPWLSDGRFKEPTP